MAIIIVTATENATTKERGYPGLVSGRVLINGRVGSACTRYHIESRRPFLSTSTGTVESQRALTIYSPVILILTLLIRIVAIKRNIAPGNFAKPSPVTIAWLRSPAPGAGFYCCSISRKNPFPIFGVLVSENKHRPPTVPCWAVVAK